MYEISNEDGSLPGCDSSVELRDKEKTLGMILVLYRGSKKVSLAAHSSVL